MRRIALLLVAALLCAMLIACQVGTAVAEPGKNQITVTATCDNGQSYTFVIDAMSKTGHVIGSTSNIVVKGGTARFFNQAGNQVGSEDLGHGKQEGLQGDLITCHGETTTTLHGLGLVTSVFDIQAFVTPRGNG